MKKSFAQLFVKMILAFIGVAFFPCSSPAQTNFISNPSFEAPNISPAAVSSQTPAGWSGVGGGLIINPTFFAANQSTYFPLPATDGAQVFELSASSAISQTVALSAGEYDFSFDLSVLQLQDGPATYDAVVDLNITDNHSDNFSQVFSLAANRPAWWRFAFDFDASATENYVITLSTPASDASVLDNLLLRPGVVPEPGSAVLLALGLPILLLCRRRNGKN